MPEVTLRRATERDKDFLFALKKSALKDYVVATWGQWDETWQREYFEKNFDPNNQLMVVVSGKDIGILTVHYKPDRIFLADIELIPEYQNRGIGSYLIDMIKQEAAAKGIPLSLRVLKENPALNLYRQLGFTTTETTGTHHVMSWEARRVKIIEAYRAAYPKGVVLNKGDTVTVQEKESEWPDWSWCTGDGETFGWIPDSYLIRKDKSILVKYNYDGTELTVAVGDELAVLDEDTDWLRCLTDDGKVGWVPQANASYIGE